MSRFQGASSAGKDQPAPATGISSQADACSSKRPESAQRSGASADSVSASTPSSLSLNLSSSSSSSSRSEDNHDPQASSRGVRWIGCRTRGRFARRSRRPAFCSKTPMFEAYIGYSWWHIDVLEPSIENGRLWVLRKDGHHEEETVSEDLIRLRSRTATCTDCPFLQTGADVCVFAFHDQTSSRAWYDGRIIEIERRPHKAGLCDCRFMVELYVVGDVWGDVTLPDSSRRVKLGNIRLLQGPYQLEYEDILEEAVVGTQEEQWLQWSRDVYSLRDLRRLVMEEAVSEGEGLNHEELGTSDDSEELYWTKARGKRSRHRKRQKKMRKNPVSSSSSEDEGAELAAGDDIGGKRSRAAGEADIGSKRSRGAGEENMSRKRSRAGKKRSASNPAKKKHRTGHGSTVKETPGAKRKSKLFKLIMKGESSSSDSPEEEDLDIEQGYVVDISAYWNLHALQDAEEKEEEEQGKSKLDEVWREVRSALGYEKPAEQEMATDEDEFGNNCSHEYEMDDYVGIVCRECGHVKTRVEKMWGIPVESSYRMWQKQNEEDEQASEEDEGAEERPRLGLKPEHLKRYEKEMYAHQRQAIHFLARNLIEEKGGCILAHSPGTGKTFTCIAFYDMFRRMHIKGCRLLILAPKAMLQAWQGEFHKWNVDVDVYIMSSDMKYKQKKETLSAWIRQQGVLVASYALFVSVACDDSAEKYGRRFQRYLLDGPDLLFLDEGHYLRTKKTNVSLTLSKVTTKLRVLLSGTLFQNNFVELFNLYYLVRPDFIKRLDGWFELQRTSNDEKEFEEEMARRLFVRQIGAKFEHDNEKLVQDEATQKLVTLTRSFTDHYKGEILKQLPGLYDYVVILRLTQMQKEFYDNMNSVLEGLEAELACTYICIHPYLFSTLGFKDKVKDLVQDARLLRKNMDAGVKMKFVLDLIANTSEKVLVFSEQRPAMKLLEEMLETCLGWSKDQEILRLDGSLKICQRQEVIQKFNSVGDVSRVCLASIKACSEGITLTGASRVVFFHTVWNASQMNQAISRAFRLGQRKKVYVYRLLADVPEELKKNSRTGWKDWVASRIFDRPGGPAAPAPGRSNMEEIMAEDLLLKRLMDGGHATNVEDVLKNKMFLQQQEEAA